MDEEFQFLDERILYINPSELSLYKKLEKIAEENNKKDPKLLIIKTAQDALSVIVESEVLVAIRGIERNIPVAPHNVPPAKTAIIEYTEISE